MAGKPGKKDKEPPQIERFKKMAKELGADEGAEAFDREFMKVVAPEKSKAPRRGRPD
jgi:hypothetical protein